MPWLERMFYAVLRMALPGSLCILAVLAARLLLRRMPARLCWALWGAAAFRLLCPAAPAAPFGLLPDADGLVAAVGMLGQGSAAGSAAGSISGGYPPAWWLSPDLLLPGGVGAGGTSGLLSAPAAAARGADSFAGTGWQALAALVWLTVAMGLFCWQLVLLFRLGRRLRGAVPGPDGVTRLPGLETAFVFGLARPRICLPAGLDPQEERMILAHERAHLRRGDHLTRPLAWVLVCVYWFDPLVWLGYCLAMRDMERCSDEAALRSLGPGARQAYARALLASAVGRPAAPWAPAFGQGDIKSRIRQVLRGKAPARWALALAGMGAAAVCAALVFAPAGTPAVSPADLAGRVYRYEKEGFGGEFTIRLEADGSFKYYEGSLSSYLGVGSWALEDGILTLRDDDQIGFPLVNRFEVAEDALIFREEGSSNFLYIKVRDGERFLPVAELPAGPEPPESAAADPADSADGSETDEDEPLLTFWIKPDEPPEVLGRVAAGVWLTAQTDPAVPDEQRLAGYEIKEVSVVAGTPPAGERWEEMPYQYLVRVDYDIRTASEAYLAPGDGVAGKGSFSGLFRELAVKALEGGSYAIVSAGTGGAGQAFGQDGEPGEPAPGAPDTNA